MNPFMHVRKGTLLKLIPAVLLLALTIMVGCGSKGKEEAEEDSKAAFNLGEPVNDSTIAAIVTFTGGSDTLTTAEFRQRYQMIRMRFPSVETNTEQAREVRRRIVEDFAMRQAFLQEVRRQGIKADTLRVQAQLNQIRGQFATEQEYLSALAAERLTEDSLRASIAEMVQMQELQQKMADAVAQPNAKEMEDYRKEQSEQVRAQHILFLVEPGSNPQKEDSTRKRALAVLDSAKKGIDFAALARRHSDDGSAQQGGDLDFFSRGQMVPQFEKAAFALKDSGDVSPDLVKTRYGYHIIRLTGRRTAAPMDTAQARQMMLNERKQKAVEQGVNNLKKTVTVRVNPKVVDADLNKPLEVE